MKYLGFCEKYGVTAVHIPGHGVPMALYAAQAAYMGSSVTGAAWAGFMMGGVGMLCAVFANAATNKKLSGQNIGMTRGGRIVRRNQLAAYAVPVLGAMACFGVTHDSADNAAAENETLRPAAMQDRVQGIAPLPVPGQAVRIALPAP
jgi:hypothetical protein